MVQSKSRGNGVMHTALIRRTESHMKEDMWLQKEEESESIILRTTDNQNDL